MDSSGVYPPHCGIGIRDSREYTHKIVRLANVDLAAREKRERLRQLPRVKMDGGAERVFHKKKAPHP